MKAEHVFFYFLRVSLTKTMFPEQALPTFVGRRQGVPAPATSAGL